MILPTAVSLFSGCGGLCEGIESAGFRVLCAVEKDRYAADTYRYNFPDIPLFEGDVVNFLAPEADQHVREYGLDKVDLVFGGPPCQGYSQIGARDLDDDRNGLYREFIRVVTELRPPLFLMENVPNLLLMNKGHFKNLILADFRQAGYANTTFVQAVASDYGVPQDRKRVFFIGIRDDLQFPYGLQQFIQNILAGLKVTQRVTVNEAIGDLPAHVVPSGHTMPYPAQLFSDYQRLMRLDVDYAYYTREAKMERGIRRHDTIELHNHHTKEIQERRLALIALLQPGKKANSLPKDVWNGLRPEKWRRLHPDLPAYTLLANMHRDLSEFVHPSLNRWITVREAARLQSFHDGFVFVGSEWQQLKQIGNAVPPLLGRAMGLVTSTILETLLTGVHSPLGVSSYTQTVLPVY